MSSEFIQDILSLVEKPSQYLGTEPNIKKKQADQVRLRFCLAFPDLYEIGTSHFGMQILYHVLNRLPGVMAERVFAPAVDMEQQLRRAGRPLVSLETKTPLNKMDIIGVSLLYELNYTNILTILELGGIPFFAAERGETDPLIIAGGPCMCNPEPIADFFDAIVVGDGEQVIQEMMEAWLLWQASGKGAKQDLLQAWSELDGVYIPSLYPVEFDSNGFQRLSGRSGNPPSAVRRRIESNLADLPFPDQPIVPYGRPVHDRLRLEIARGCTRGCRFCQAGMIYRPVRERSVEQLLKIAQQSLPATGYEDISLLSLSTGDYGCLSLLIQELMARWAKDHVAISLPSVRAGTLTSTVMQSIQSVRKTGFTIAPEAGTQRLRDVINKNITMDEIIATVSQAFDLGWQLIKLYFMIGLPTETAVDRDGIVELVKTLRKVNNPKQKFRKINVSVTTFIPKPQVPFQWESQISMEQTRAYISQLKRELKLPGVNFKYQIPELSLLEGLFARGDRRLSSLIVRAYQKGCRFDGWTDQFRYNLWMEAVEELGIDMDFYTTRDRNITEPLPWDHIDSGVTKEYLIKERKRALQGKSTDDCRTGACNDCGVCDFQSIEPVVATLPEIQKAVLSPPAKQTGTDSPYRVFHVTYTKKDQARYFGHLEMVNLIFRAIRRAHIPVVYSEGFHPKPKISFDDPIPLGMESEAEYFDMRVREGIRSREIVSGLNQHLPEGFQVTDCHLTTVKKRAEKPSHQYYRVGLQAGSLDADKLNILSSKQGIFLEYRTKKGKLKKIDLAAMIEKVEIVDDRQMNLVIRREAGRTIRPFDVLTKVFDLPDADARQARVIKLRTFSKPINES